MPDVTRVGDSCTGHDACSAVPLKSGSPNVMANGIPVGRVGDKYQSHGCLVHSSHSDGIASGSSTVRANGLSLARVGDSVSMGGSVAVGSKNVRAGG